MVALHCALLKQHSTLWCRYHRVLANTCKNKSDVTIHMWQEDMWKLPIFPVKKTIFVFVNDLFLYAKWTFQMWKTTPLFQNPHMETPSLFGLLLLFTHESTFLHLKWELSHVLPDNAPWKKKSWLWRCGTRSESTHVFNSTSSNWIKEEKGAETAALSTYTVIHLHLALCWCSSVATAYARFTTSLGPLGWMEKQWL